MNKTASTIAVLCVACTGAFIGYLLKVPIGIQIGSFLAAEIAQMAGLGAPPLNKKGKHWIQMAIGGVVGLNVTHDLLPVILGLLIPGVIAAAVHLLFAYFFAEFLSKYFGLDWATAFCGCIPAGLSEATITAGEVGADVQVVMLMHLFRVSLLITLLPLLLSFLMKLSL